MPLNELSKRNAHESIHASGILHACEVEMRRLIVAWRGEPADFELVLTVAQQGDLLVELLMGIRDAADAAFIFCARTSRAQFKEEIQHLASVVIPDCAAKLW